jgi:predicted helicase
MNQAALQAGENAALFDTEAAPPKAAKRHGVTDDALKHFQSKYENQSSSPAGTEAAKNDISKDDIFFYIYGLLHSEDYKKRYADNLSKELPRIPAVKKFTDFMAFSTAGRALAELHVNYEHVAPYPVSYAGGAIEHAEFTDADYRVVQMKFAKGAGKSGDERHDKTQVIYNHKITMTGIPLAAYEYVVNGKPALEWVMERQSVTTHKDSGIVNDANLWALETMNDAQYPLKLFQRVITVSLETVKIVNALPRLDI